MSVLINQGQPQTFDQIQNQLETSSIASYTTQATIVPDQLALRGQPMRPQLQSLLGHQSQPQLASQQQPAAELGLDAGLVGAPADPNVQVNELSDEAKQAIKKHDEIMKQYEKKKAISKLHSQIPTADKLVKFKLREMGHPICLFGETAADRRERLKQICAQYIVEQGVMPNFNNLQPLQENPENEENEHFWYKGPPELQQIRTEIANHSLRKAALRIEGAKLKRCTIDPLEEEDQVQQQLAQIKNYEVVMQLFGDTSTIFRGAFTKDQRYFGTAGGSGECKIWTIPECKLKTRLYGHLTKAHDIQFHPECMLGLSSSSYANIATCSSDTTIRLWQFEEDKELQKSVQLKGHSDRLNRILFHQLGKYLLSTSHDHTWRFWDLEKQKDVIIQTGHTSEVYSLGLHPDGSIVFTGDFGGMGALWDLRSGKNILQLIGHVKSILCSDFSSNGYQIATGGDDNQVRIWDIRRKACMHQIPAHIKLISDCKFQPEHSKFLTTVSYDNKIKMWNAHDWSLVKSVQGSESKVTSISSTADTKYMATTCFDRKWMLWKF